MKVSCTSTPFFELKAAVIAVSVMRIRPMSRQFMLAFPAHGSVFLVYICATTLRIVCLLQISILYEMWECY